MLRNLGLAFSVVGTVAGADVRFAPVDVPDHIYDGGWEHFVGGGVAAFDCDNDGMPELYAAGGENRAQLFLHTTKDPGGGLFRFSRRCQELWPLQVLRARIPSTSIMMGWSTR